MIPKKRQKTIFALKPFFLMNAGQTLGWVERGEGIMCLAMKLWLLDRLCVTLSRKPKTHLFFAANLKTDQFFFQKISDYVGARIMWEYKKSSNNQSQNCANLTPFFFLGIFYRYRQHIFFKDFLADGVFLLPVHWKAIKNDSWTNVVEWSKRNVEWSKRNVPLSFSLLLQVTSSSS